MFIQPEVSQKTVKDSTPQNNWFYPADFKNGLTGIDLRGDQVCEAINTAWEYVRIVIPSYTNWNRYVSFARLMLIAVIVEMRGSLVDVVAGDNILGFQIDELVDQVFAGNPGHMDEMVREFRTFLLFTAEKVSERRTSDFFRRYVNALAHSPKNWFRLRDWDGLARFTLAGAMACNDVDVWFSENGFQILCEIAESGRNTQFFAYVDQKLRAEAFHRCRETLWRFEVAWARMPKNQCVLNFVPNFGGTLHMTARRYRFVEDGLIMGKPETEDVVNKTRQNFKLWNRVNAKISEGKGEGDPNQLRSSYYSDIYAQKTKLMFDGLPKMLERGDIGQCKRCRYRLSYSAEAFGHFGGVELCEPCKDV